MAIQKILCIEDDRFIGEMYVRTLQKAGYNVEWVVDGSDGLVAARNKAYDLIILDLMLPEQRGEQVLDALRHDDIDLVPDAKILIMTNFELDDARRNVLLQQADGYLIKADITPRNMLSIIKDLSEN